jgi:hypothetical protein
MRLPVVVRLWQDPFHAIATGEAVHRLALFGPYQALIAGVPVQLEVALFLQEVGDGEGDPEPMGGPAGAEGLADARGLELVRDGVLEGGTGQVGRRVDLEADPFIAGGSAFVELTVAVRLCGWSRRCLPEQILGLVLPTSRKLLQTIQVNAVDLGAVSKRQCGGWELAFLPTGAAASFG